MKQITIRLLGLGLIAMGAFLLAIGILGSDDLYGSLYCIVLGCVCLLLAAAAFVLSFSANEKSMLEFPKTPEEREDLRQRLAAAEAERAKGLAATEQLRARMREERKERRALGWNERLLQHDREQALVAAEKLRKEEEKERKKQEAKEKQERINAYVTHRLDPSDRRAALQVALYELSDSLEKITAEMVSSLEGLHESIGAMEEAQRLAMQKEELERALQEEEQKEENTGFAIRSFTEGSLWDGMEEMIKIDEVWGE